MADQEQIIVLTADIVAAHVSNNTVAVGDIGQLVQKVHQALAGLGAPPAEEPPLKKDAVVSVRASIKPDYIVCMECGKRQKTLKRHLQVAHGLTPDQYRADFGLPGTYPMVAPNYSLQRQELAKSSGLGRRPAQAAPAKPARRGRPKGGSPAA
jgi:predicted transcriptional regulator